MDGDFLTIVIKTVFSLAFVVFLVYLTFRLGGTSLNRLQDGKFAQLVDRLAISKDNSILVVKIGMKYYLVSSTHERLEIIRELDAEEEKLLLEKRNIEKFATFQDIYFNFKRKGRKQ